MRDRSAHRRAGIYGRKAADLAEQAKWVRDDADRWHMLELAAQYQRAADNLAPRAAAIN